MCPVDMDALFGCAAGKRLTDTQIAYRSQFTVEVNQRNTGTIPGRNGKLLKQILKGGGVSASGYPEILAVPDTKSNPYPCLSPMRQTQSSGPDTRLQPAYAGGHLQYGTAIPVQSIVFGQRYQRLHDMEPVPKPSDLCTRPTNHRIPVPARSRHFR